MKDKVDYKKIIANTCLELKDSFGLQPIVGAEVEFYLVDNDIATTSNILKEITRPNLKLEKEKGVNQHEFVLAHSYELLPLVEQIIASRTFITSVANQHSATASFAAKPIANDYGSALHMHLSLHTDTQRNIFSDATYNENMHLGYVIGGLLDIAQEAVYLLCKTEEDYARFTPNLMAPTTVSWGGNNRTTIIRIPDSKPENRRIEYRLAPANCCPYALTSILLVGALHGLQHKIQPPSRIYGIADDPQYNLATLPKSLSEAKAAFYNKGILLNYLKNIYGH